MQGRGCPALDKRQVLAKLDAAFLAAFLAALALALALALAFARQPEQRGQQRQRLEATEESRELQAVEGGTYARRREPGWGHRGAAGRRRSGAGGADPTGGAAAA